jgi:heptosyltransferase-1
MADFRILVIRLSSMGDVIHTLPAAASLKHSFPRSFLSWLVRPRWVPLLEDNSFIDRIVPVERDLAATLRVMRVLRRDAFDLVVDFQGLFQSAVLAGGVRSHKKIGLHRSQVRERFASLFYSSAVLTHSEHRVDRNLELAVAAGATSLLRVFPVPYGRPEGVLPEGPFVLASPGAGWGAKQWPAAYYAEVARELEMPLVVNGPPGAASALARIPGAQVHISGVAGLVDATRRASAVIGVDSGPLHLAAALSKPGVAIYGPTDPAIHGPYGGSIRVLRAADAITDYKRRPEEDDSMRAILPAAVLQSLGAAMEAALHPPPKTGAAGSPV